MREALTTQGRSSLEPERQLTCDDWRRVLIISVLDEPVHLSEWKSDWALRARLIANETAQVLGGSIIVEHIGSTAVEGMIAKPIVDLMIGAPQETDRRSYARKLSRLDWEDMGEAGIPGRLYLRRRSSVQANIHIVLKSSLMWDNNVMLQDFLIAHPEMRTAYSAMKVSILADGADQLLLYSQRKAAFIARLLERASAWRSSMAGDG